MPLLDVAGRDATDPFESYHPEEVWKRLPNFHVANLAPEDIKETALEKDHRALRKKFEEFGWYKTNYTFYYWMAVRLVAMFATAMYFILGKENMSARLFGSFMLGFFW